jgi:hypothetical protein
MAAKKTPIQDLSDVAVRNFESIASKWLCNKKFLHFNLVTSAVLWELWINRNNLVFNKVTWINIKQVRRLVLSFLRDWKVPFKVLVEGEKKGQFMDLLLAKRKKPLSLQEA